jgi:UDP-N-acetylglucosamine transferase subunit ALG13
MKVLFVCSGNSEFGISPFIKEQGESLEKIGMSIDYFLIKGHGLFGYLKNLPRLNKQIKKIKYDLIHAHYGLSGMLSVLQRKIPVIITFHGSDINNSYHRKFSKIAMQLSEYNIFVHKSIKDKVNAKKNIL